MGGFHPLDLIVIIGVALLIFGPKTLQSLSHNAGRGMGQAKGLKDKVMAEMPMEELSKVTTVVSQIPLSPQQAAQRLLVSSLVPDEKKTQAAQEATNEPVAEQN
jgi:Sec-independent protein translocase protein TatA